MNHYVYKKKLLATLIVLLILFAAVFIAALIGLNKNYSLFSTGLPVGVENILVMILSVLSMIKVIHEIHRL